MMGDGLVLVFADICRLVTGVVCVNPRHAEGSTEQRDSVSADNVHLHCRRNHIIVRRLFQQNVVSAPCNLYVSDQCRGERKQGRKAVVTSGGVCVWRAGCTPEGESEFMISPSPCVVSSFKSSCKECLFVNECTFPVTRCTLM